MITCGEFVFVFIFTVTILDLGLECKWAVGDGCKVLKLCVFQLLHIFTLFSWFITDYLITTVLIFEDNARRIANMILDLFGNICFLTFLPYFYYFFSKRI